MSKTVDTYVATIDRITEVVGKTSAWVLFLIGFFITYEVVMRYVFTAPTIWVDEVSRVLQVWVVYMAAPYVLKHNEMVTISVFMNNPHTFMRKIAETFAVLIMFIFAGVACYYGFELWLKSTLAGHTTDTFLALPIWLTHAPVWLGSGLLVLQGFVRLVRIWNNELQADDVLEGHH